MPDSRELPSQANSHVQRQKAAEWIRSEVARQVGVAMQQGYYRQQQQIDEQAQQIQALRADNRQLLEKVRQQQHAVQEFNAWAEQIYGHVGSVDEKSERITEISTVLFTIVELLQWPLPYLERFANGILSVTKKIRAMEKRKRSRVDGRPLNDLLD